MIDAGTRFDSLVVFEGRRFDVHTEEHARDSRWFVREMVAVDIGGEFWVVVKSWPLDGMTPPDFFVRLNSCQAFYLGPPT